MSKLNPVDYSVIGVYFLILIAFGFILSRRASKSLEHYFLGGRKLPWWALGMSGTASWFDITGTMLIVSFLYMLGPRGIYIEFRGGACLVLAFMLVFTGKWHRRSGCITGAEWQIYRFGTGAGAQFARVLTAVASILAPIGMIAYLIKGVGGFLTVFFPFWSPMICAFIMVAIATLYTMASGFYGVVVTDVIQTAIIFIAVGVITTMAVLNIGEIGNIDEYAQQVTQRDFVRNETDRELEPDAAAGRQGWTDSSPVSPRVEVPMQRGYEQYSWLTMFAFFYLLKNTFAGMGSGGDPRYFGARNERECGLLSAMWGGLIMIRWPMMMGFTVLGLVLVNEFFADRDEDALWRAQVLIKQDAVAEKDPDFELNLEKAARVEAECLASKKWEDLLKDPSRNSDAVAKLEVTLGADWKSELETLVKQKELLDEVAPKKSWGQVLTAAMKKEKLAGELKKILGEEDFDTKVTMISHEGTVNPEQILPAVLLKRIPFGIRGLLLVALLAASMSTFDTTVNMATAFFTRDLYQRYFHRAAKNRELMLASYAFGVVLVAAGFGMAAMADNINDIWGWIIMSLTAGLAVPGILRLYWWRFNAGGVVASSIVGLSVPFLQRFAYPELHEWAQFGIVTGITLVAALVGTLITEPTDAKTLRHFYKTTRPFGFWGPMKKTLKPELRKKVAREHRNDMLAVPFVMVWQVTLYMLPMQLVIREWGDFKVTLAIHAVAVLGMYKFWYKNLPPKREGIPTEEEIDAGQI